MKKMGMKSSAPDAADPCPLPGDRTGRLARGFWLKAIISLVFIGLIFSWVRGRDLGAVLASVDPIWVLASFAVSAAMITISCLKWHLLLRVQGHQPRFTDLLRLYLIGYFFGNLLPTNVGGDVVRSWYAGNAIGNQTDAAVSVFLERFTGVLVMFLLAALGPLAVPGLIRSKWIWIPVVLVSILLLGFVVVMAFPRLLDLAARLAARVTAPVPPLARMTAKVFTALDGFQLKLRDALDILWRRPRLLAAVIGITLVFYGLTWLNIHVTFRAFGHDPGWPAIIAVTAVAMLTMMIPALPGALGLAEASYMKYFSLVGTGVEVTLAMGLLLRLKLWVIGAIGFWFYWRSR